MSTSAITPTTGTTPAPDSGANPAAFTGGSGEPLTVSASAAVGNAHRIGESVGQAALDTEQHRTISPELVSVLRDAGLFHLMAPAVLGGLEAEPRIIVETIEELSRADAATGWTVLIGQGAGFLAWLDLGRARDLVTQHPRPIVVGSMAPVGHAEAVPVGEESEEPALRVSGRWSYVSGCQVADLIFAAFTAPDGAPNVRFGFFTRSQMEVHDTWRAAGLCGSGSHDVSVADAHLPTALTFDPFGPARLPGPLYRLPYQAFLAVAMAGFPLGVARRVVQEYRAVATTKRTVEGVRLADTPAVQADLARWSAAVDAARAGVFEAVERIWREALAGTPSRQGTARFIGAVQHATRTAGEVADSGLRASGAGQIYLHAPLQRCFRDIQAAAAHIAFQRPALSQVGAALLGVEPPPLGPGGPGSAPGVPPIQRPRS